jgi:pimeloyl-ACP methyl ester carboxylesterase
MIKITWNEGVLPVGGFSLHYYRAGGGKKPLIMAHGFTDDGLCWSSLAETLYPDYDLILYEELGHGKSNRVNQLPSRDAFDPPGHLDALIRHLGLVKPIILGHSMGAATAARFAAQHPELPSALLLEDLPWIEPEEENPNDIPPDGKEPYFYKLKKMQTQTLEEIIAYGRIRHPRWREAAVRRWAAAKQRFDLDFYDLRPPFRPDYPSLLPGITCPVLLISGDESLGGIITPQKARRALEIMPSPHWAHIPDAGHCIRYEQFDAYCSAVQRFLAVHA